MALNEAVFGRPFNEGLVHQLITAYQARARAGTKAQKTRAQVSGGGAKPWRQKGTGRARAGSSRSPIWRSGGVTFAAKPRSFKQKVNTKMYRAGMRSILSELARQDRLKIVDDFVLAEPRTKLAKDKLAELACDHALIIQAAIDMPTYLACRNLPNIHLIDTQSINPYDLVRYDQVVLTKAALARVEEMFA